MTSLSHWFEYIFYSLVFNAVPSRKLGPRAALLAFVTAIGLIVLVEQLQSLPGTLEDNTGDNNSKPALVYETTLFQVVPGTEISISAVSNAAALSNASLWPTDHRCVFYHSNGTLMAETEGKVYTSYSFSCQHPGNHSGIPTYVFLYRQGNWSLEETDNWSRYGCSVLDRVYIFIAAVIYGDPGPYWLLVLQFFEYYRAKGVERFIIRFLGPDSLSAENAAIFKYYQSLGLLELIKWERLEYRFCAGEKALNTPVGKYCQNSQYQDFAKTYAYQYDYIIIADFDELMRGIDLEEPLLDVVAKVDNPSIGSFVFKFTVSGASLQALPLPVVAESEPEQRRILLRNHTPWFAWLSRRAKFTQPDKQWPKTLIKPATVKKMWCHFVPKHYPGYREHIMNPQIEGLLLHFKNITSWDKRDQNIANRSAHFELNPNPELSDKELEWGERLLANMSRALDVIIRDFYA